MFQARKLLSFQEEFSASTMLVLFAIAFLLSAGTLFLRRELQKAPIGSENSKGFQFAPQKCALRDDEHQRPNSEKNKRSVAAPVRLSSSSVRYHAIHSNTRTLISSHERRPR